MSDLQAIADRVEIEALRGEFTDAVMMRDYSRVASLFTPDGGRVYEVRYLDTTPAGGLGAGSLAVGRSLAGVDGRPGGVRAPIWDGP
jgi:hypothetical protein